MNHSDETPNLQYSEDVIGQKIELFKVATMRKCMFSNSSNAVWDDGAL